MNRGVGTLVLGVLLGCSGPTATEEGVATLALLTPFPAEVEAGQTIFLSGAALGADGDTLAIPVYWIALDTTIVVDSVTGALTGRNAGTVGKVIAVAGGLYSPRVTYAILFPADTLVRVGPATSTMVAADTISADLQARLDLHGVPPKPVLGRRLIYQLVEPAFNTPEDRTVELSGGSLTQVATTTSFGMAPIPIRVRPLVGRTRPDSAVVTVSAWRPGGDPIPGTGHRFTIYFVQP